METIKKELENTFKLLSAIPVSGDAVDVMCACRASLRRAYQLLGDTSGTASTQAPAAGEG